jgi:hypothetical protein
LLQSAVEDLPGRPDERMALAVLAVAWLLANEHHPGPRRTLADDDLGGMLGEVARVASRRRVAEPRQRRPLGNRRRWVCVGVHGQ